MRIVGLLVLVLLLVGALWPAKVVAPQIVDLTPQKGRVDQLGIVHGEGLKSGTVEIKFGQTGSVLVSNPQTVSDEVVKFNIPDTPSNDRDPTNPNIVKVTISIGSDMRTFQFEYDPPGQQPVINSIDPVSVPAGAPFTITFSGAYFTNNQGRMPDDAWLLSAPAAPGVLRVASIGETSLSVDWGPVGTEGTYQIIVGFTDGSAASTAITVTAH